mmetsp:Transcript_13232/g.28694  ORF Transcript_13232/g.28694 Transcript_13232/m.28694 type:complete len:207 (-) Transcript_13232:330-950(-)
MGMALAQAADTRTSATVKSSSSSLLVLVFFLRCFLIRPPGGVRPNARWPAYSIKLLSPPLPPPPPPEDVPVEPPPLPSPSSSFFKKGACIAHSPTCKLNSSSLNVGLFVEFLPSLHIIAALVVASGSLLLATFLNRARSPARRWEKKFRVERRRGWEMWCVDQSSRSKYSCAKSLSNELALSSLAVRLFLRSGVVVTYPLLLLVES